MIKLKDLLLEFERDTHIYDRSGSSSRIDFSGGSSSIDKEIEELKKKKVRFLDLRQVAKKLHTRWKKLDNLSNKQLESPQWQTFEKAVDRDVKRLEEDLDELGFGNVDLDWRWDGVK